MPRKNLHVSLYQLHTNIAYWDGYLLTHFHERWKHTRFHRVYFQSYEHARILTEQLPATIHTHPAGHYIRVTEDYQINRRYNSPLKIDYLRGLWDALPYGTLTDTHLTITYIDSYLHNFAAELYLTTKELHKYNNASPIIDLPTPIKLNTRARQLSIPLDEAERLAWVFLWKPKLAYDPSNPLYSLIK